MRIDLPIYTFPGGLHGGNRVLISKSILSGSTAQVDFTFPAGFIGYEVVGVGILVDTDDVEIYVNLSSDNGATFISTASAYEHARIVHNATEGGQAGQGDAADSKIIISNIAAAAGIGTAAGEGTNFKLIVANAHLATIAPMVYGFVSMIDASTRPSTSTFGGILSALTVVNAIRFTLNSGTFTAGKFHLYGIN